MRRTILALLTALALTAGLAACGGGDSAPTVEEYAKEFTPINAEIKALGREVGDAVVTARKKTNTEIATEFKTLAGRANEVGGDLNNLDPPDDEAIKKDQAVLVEALYQGSRDLTSISNAAAANDAKAAAAAAAKLVADSDDIRKPRERLEKAIAADAASSEQ